MTVSASDNCLTVSAAAVANEFISLSLTEPNLPTLDQMKLQKLVFYAHAWHLAIKQRPLFEEDIEAWPWGPVVRDIYAQTKEYGRSPITSKIQSLVVDDEFDFVFIEPEINDPETKEFIKNVWDSHKNFSGVQLSNSTHAEGEPWTVIKEKYTTLDNKPHIPNEVIRTIFEKKLSDGK